MISVTGVFDFIEVSVEKDPRNSNPKALKLKYKQAVFQTSNKSGLRIFSKECAPMAPKAMATPSMIAPKPWILGLFFIDQWLIDNESWDFNRPMLFRCSKR